ncbi:MAG: RNA-binding cell elongation regulator Jag/EloR [Lachnospiraceae bacterium]|nr:RNA-binding cell elongation regulator Jag/EloR [Lachnospiraceae bacterium]
MDYKNFTAKTVDEAITQACLELAVTSDRLDFDVIQEASSGFLGLRSKPAIIRARVRSEEETESKRKAIEEAEKKNAELSAPADSKKKAPAAKKQNSEAKKNDAAAPETAENKADNAGAKIITSDEIEKRAAAAAEKAKAEGREVTPREPREGGRRERRERDRDGRGRNDRRNRDRRNSREQEVPEVHHEPSKPKPERVIKQRTEEEAAALVKAADDFLKDVFKAMNLNVEISIEYDQKEGAVNCTFNGEEMGLLIGKRGQTLDSLQYLTSLVVNKTTDEYVRVKLDTEDYRSRRSDTLHNLARNIAYKVKKTHRPVALEPMNPYERRIIHSSLQNNKFVETYSEGEEPYRHVVVAPKH